MSLTKEGALARLGRSAFSLISGRAGGLVVSALFALAIVAAPTSAFAAPHTSTVLTVQSASGVYGGTVNLSATLVHHSTFSGDTPVPNETISFSLDGKTAVTAVTNSSGVATLNNVSLSGISAATYSSTGHPAGIAASFAGDSIYTSSNGNATLTVSKELITLTADAKTKTAGAADPALTYTITTGALVGSDTLTGSLTRDAGETVGTYAIKQGTLAASSNYMLTFVGANLTITAAAPSTGTLTVTTNVVGGSATASSFPLTLDGMAITSGTATTTSAASHTVAVGSVANYTAVIGGTDCNVAGQVTVPASGSASCTVTETYTAPAGPTVTINQAVGQADPATASPIDFTVIFSSAVNDFSTGDVTLSGTAGATTATVTGSGNTYSVAVSGMTQSGTVIASVAAGVAHDSSNNANSASTATDNTVTYSKPGVDCSLTYPSPDLVANPCLESGSAWNGTVGGPDNWNFYMDSGVNGGGMYPAASQYSGTKAAEVHINAGSPAGQVQWSPSPFTVTQGQAYTYSDKYMSNVDTEVDVEYIVAKAEAIGADGCSADDSDPTNYVDCYEVLSSSVKPSPSGFSTFSSVIAPPPGTKSMSVFHLLDTSLPSAVASLTIDDVSVSAGVAAGDQYSQGMVSLTFDDGYLDHYTGPVSDAFPHGSGAFEILQNAPGGAMHGTFYMIPNITLDQADYTGYMTTAQMLEMQAAGNDMASHTADHCDLVALFADSNSAKDGGKASGNAGDPGIGCPDHALSNATTSQAEITNSKIELQGMGATPDNNLAYPFGSFSSDITSQVAAGGFSAARTIDEGFNTRSTDPYRLVVQDLDTSTTPAEVHAWIDTALANHIWLILVFHQIEENPANANDTYAETPETLQDTVNYLSQTHACVLTVSQVITNTSCTASNEAPVLAAVGDKTATVGAPFSFTATATDANNDMLTFSASSLPVGASITTGGVFSWTPTANQIGATTTTITVDDSHGGTDSEIVTITVGNPTLTATAINQSIVFGSAAPDLTSDFWFSGFQNADATSSIETLPTCSVAGDHTAVGTYQITCSGGADDLYAFAYVNGTLTVAPVDGTIVLSNLDQTYDGTPKAVATSTGDVTLSVTVTYEGINGTTYALSTTPPTDAGTYDVVATIDAGQSYSGSAEGTLTVAKAAVDGTDSLNQTIDVVENSTNNPITLGTLDGIDTPA
ncbi:MAG TPA: MBG domain-containing protein, partial [Candidatus Paceibacterota bacterium]|nr:MBG domain-containing protein [Candidatus Paceibacterota bacterium]